MSDPSQDPLMAPPVNPLPPSVVLLFLAIAGVEGLLSLGEAGILGGPGAIGWRLAMVRDYGFSGEIFDYMLANGVWPPEHVLRFVTFPFVHLGFTHALFAAVLMLALGKMVGEVMGNGAVLLLFFLSGIIGASVYALLLDEAAWLAGAYPNVFGLIGGYSFVLWRSLAGTGAQQLRAFSLIGMLMALQLIWGVFFEVGMQWVADLSGFLSGFALCFLVGPGQWQRLRARMQQRR